jgi:hypothetical protein
MKRNSLPSVFATQLRGRLSILIRWDMDRFGYDWRTSDRGSEHNLGNRTKN